MYELGKEDFYRYLQIQHFFFKEIQPPDPAEPSIITQIFVDTYKAKNMKGIIGKLYEGFSLINKNLTNYIRERWEKEINMVISEDVWLQIWETQSFSTNSLFWRDFSCKNLTRFFITPNQKSRFSGSQCSCWRGCGSALADHAHIFWSCPYIVPFWKEVGQLVSVVLDLRFDLSFTSMYLGHIPKDLSKSDSYLLKIFLVASKKAITKCWLQRNPPTITLLINKINSICIMEKMTFTIRLQKRRETNIGKNGTVITMWIYNVHVYCNFLFYLYFCN